jgi:outer membrane translocation and assembly module TamA
MDSEYQLTEEVRFQRQELSSQEFNLDRILFASYIFRQFNSGMTFTGGHSFALDKLLDVAPGAIITPLDEGHVRLSFFSATWKFDRRDDPLIPHRGYTFALEPRLSMQQIGSEANFGALTARSTGVVPLDFLSPRFSLGLGLTGGIGWWWDGTEEIPITQRFYTGGRTTVRGYKENSLGPEGEDGAVIGGDTLLNQRNQFQYLVADSLSTHLFLDVGTVWLREESFRIAEMRSGTGIGFQYISPIGPIGFDLGHPLDRKPGEDNLLVHFSVGSPF